MAFAASDHAEILDARAVGSFQWRVIALCTAIVFVEGMITQTPGYIGPALSQAWKLVPSQFTLFILSGLCGLMLGGLIVAPLADRIGRRPVLLACVGLFGLCSIATAASTSLAMLDGIRFVTGLGIGGAMPNAIALTAEYSPRRRRSTMVALMLNGFILGSVAAGLLTARLVPLWGWQGIFLVGGILPLLLLPCLIFALPESVRFLILNGGPRETIARLLARIDARIAVEEAILAVSREHRPGRIFVTALFQDGLGRTTMLVWLVYFMSLLNLFLLASWLPTLMHALGLPVGLAILIATLLQVGGVFGSVSGWVQDRVGPSKTIFCAYAIGALSIACIGLAGSNPVLLMFAVFGAGFGIVGGQSAANAVAAIAYPTRIRSTGVGWATGIGRLGSIAGPALAGILLAMNFSSQHIFFLAVIPAVLAALAGAAFGNSPVALGVPDIAPAEA